MNTRTIFFLVLAFNCCFAWEQVDNFVRNVDSAKSECTESDKYGVPDSWFANMGTYLTDLYDKGIKPLYKTFDQRMMNCKTCKPYYVKLWRNIDHLQKKGEKLYQDKIGKYFEDDTNDYKEAFSNFVTFGACSLNKIFGGMGYLIFATVDTYLFVTMWYTLYQILFWPFKRMLRCCFGKKGKKTGKKVVKEQPKDDKDKPKPKEETPAKNESAKKSGKKGKSKTD